MTLALPILYDAVEARFTAEATPCALAFGWREAAKQFNGPRIVMVPGDNTGAAFEVLPVKQPGRNPRPLAALAELFHVVISNTDTSSPENERLQYIACRTLFDAWWRAAFLAAGHRLVHVSSDWMDDRSVRRNGATLVVTATIDGAVLDACVDTASLLARGEMFVSELDVTQYAETAPSITEAVAMSGDMLGYVVAMSGDMAGNRVGLSGDVL